MLTTGRSAYSSQKGFTLLELMIVLVIIASLTVVFLNMMRDYSLTRMARHVGNNAAQVVNALRSYISMNPSTPSATYTGIDWLRSNTCAPTPGTATDHYLPCWFTNNPGMQGLNYTIQITNGGPNNVSAILTIGPFTVNGQPRPDLSAAAASAANAMILAYHSPTSSATYYSFTSDPATATLRGVASTNPSADAHLRTDGSNQMQADITFNPSAANRDINNAATVYADTAVEAPIYRDSDAPSTFYLDPTGVSNMTDIFANSLRSIGGLTVSAAPGQQLALNDVGGDVIVGGAGGSGIIDFEDAVVRSRGNQLLSDLLPRITLKDSWRATPNQIVLKPNCPNGGFPLVYIVPRGIYDYDTVYASGYRLNVFRQWYRAVDAGGGWRIEQKHTNPSNGTDDVGESIVQTACYYP